MKLSKDQVKHIAKLANLPLSEEEEDIYSEQLSKILDHIEQLKKVNTDNIEPTYNTSSNKNTKAQDEASSSLKQEDALANASKTEKGFFVTKGVFENE